MLKLTFLSMPDELGFDENGCNTSWLGVKMSSLDGGSLSRDDFLSMTADLHNQLNGTDIRLSDFYERRETLPPHLQNMFEDVQDKETLELARLTNPHEILIPAVSISNGYDYSDDIA